ncbi:unnamed protein product [Tenebrio molitor]|nr:unnamed protein product [Tenebrio molitor]
MRYCLADVTKMEIMFESEPDILLKFPHPSQKETFANALKHFLALSNTSSPDRETNTI